MEKGVVDFTMARITEPNNRLKGRKMENEKDWEFVCADCGEKFVFSVGEQRFYLSKGLSVPKRCKACRRTRKATLNRDEEVLRWQR